MSMSRAARMMFLLAGNENDDVRAESYSEVNGKFRDNRGREHYDNGRYAPRGEYQGYVNTYRSGGNDYSMQPSSPIYRQGMEGDGSFRGEYDDGGVMRRVIGFGGAEARYDGPKREGEMFRRSSPKERGYSHSDAVPEFTREMAEDWTRDMVNSDGTRGAHWSMENAAAIMKQKGYRHDPYEWFAVLNAVYSDYAAVAKQHGLGGNLDFFAALADAWLNDEDAGENKAAKYFCKIVKH